MLKMVIATMAFVVSAGAFAQAATPVGLWKTIDDDTKKEKSLVRISESAGVLTGKLEKLLDPKAKPDEVCDKCTDERKDKPMLGLTIIRNTNKAPMTPPCGPAATSPIRTTARSTSCA